MYKRQSLTRPVVESSTAFSIISISPSSVFSVPFSTSARLAFSVFWSIVSVLTRFPEELALSLIHILMLMRFSIGRDLGFVLAKGIVISLVTVLFLMPALILRFNGLIERTEHKSFVPSFHKMGNFVYKIRYVVLAIVEVLVIPKFVAQNMNQFAFGDSALGSSPGTAA